MQRKTKVEAKFRKMDTKIFEVIPSTLVPQLEQLLKLLNILLNKQNEAKKRTPSHVKLYTVHEILKA